MASARIWATLLLLALSLAVWKWLRSTQPPAEKTEERKKTKKRTKKKTKKTNTPETAPVALEHEPHVSESEDASDSDDGLSAAQVLARRRFKPKAVGGASVNPATAAQSVRYHVGQRVLARYQGGSDWFPGVIVEVRRGNEYHVQYDDGALEHRVAHNLIKELTEETTEAIKESDQFETTKPDPSEPNNYDGESDSDDYEEEEDEDDGWQVVGGPTTIKRRAAATSSASTNVAAGDGLTKRQRESRRKRERKKEIRDMARAQAQEQGLHARWGGTNSKMRYVPPPTATPQ
ncbi:hypothetical protein Poli38472_014463 [Pythium oligandrum]|uniref:Histone methyltransferase Tudor domain-containing protein n=1 Tax=Pythium oligandrum TaxID=41045 RepID=A0A8K1CF15_PYTOL|nr:hypothetical protein Poli38472_014463 [Pythium oligandrum]|eukprot:TMW61002.1 hypothetical protein Poli38472_014463 [Pythium oligandrum]